MVSWQHFMALRILMLSQDMGFLLNIVKVQLPKVDLHFQRAFFVHKVRVMFGEKTYCMT